MILLLYITAGQLEFPTTIIFPDGNSEPIAVSGFLEPKEIEPILKYFGEGAYKTQSYNDFKSTFKNMVSHVKILRSCI